MSGIDTESEDRAMVARQGGVVPFRPWVKIAYDTHRFQFAPLLSRDVYKIKRLDKLHTHVIKQRRRSNLPSVLTRSDNLTYRQMMQHLPIESPFKNTYHRFVNRVLRQLVGRGISYSRSPKMRVHFPSTASVSSFHHDIVVTKRIDQLNLWMPFVDLEGTSTLWLESEYGSDDFAPVPVAYGEALIFDGGFLGHGAMRNETDTTRISLDARFSFKKATTREEGVALMNHLITNLEGAPDNEFVGAKLVASALPCRSFT